MSRSTPLKAGWKMTESQHRMYWRLVGQVAEATKVSREDARREIHFRAFGVEPKSAKEINRLVDFDNFLAACQALVNPADLAAQIRQVEMPRTRLVHAIRALAPEAYIVAEFRRKSGCRDFTSGDGSNWVSLSEADLNQLRNHLTARAPNLAWPEVKSGP